MRVRGAFHLLLVCLSPALLPAVRINGNEQEVLQLVEGDSVRLGCPYILDPEDHGPNGLGIEWMQVNPEPSRQEKVFLSYRDKRVNHGDLPNLQQRVRFAVPDPSQYDASINLSNLQVSDTATYECRVKKTTVATRKVTISVLARPVVPKCWYEGYMAYGNDVVLKCFVSGGSLPLTYKWNKIRGSNYPYRASSYQSQDSYHSEVSYESSYSSISQVSGVNTGELLLKDISYKDNGLYQCTVANRVGYSVCVLEIRVPGAWNIGIIIGAVLGSLLMLGCLILGIWGLVCCCCRGPRGAFCCGGKVRRKACMSNDIREDDVAPGCKAKEGGSSVTHLLGYPMQKIRRSLSLRYEPPHCEGPENLALVSSAASAALDCKADQSPGYVKVKTAEPADCAAGPPLPCKDGLLV